MPFNILERYANLDIQAITPKISSKCLTSVDFICLGIAGIDGNVTAMVFGTIDDALLQLMSPMHCRPAMR